MHSQPSWPKSDRLLVPTTATDLPSRDAVEVEGRLCPPDAATCGGEKRCRTLPVGQSESVTTLSATSAARIPRGDGPPRSQILRGLNSAEIGRRCPVSTSQR